jgi:hypothetical protein
VEVQLPLPDRLPPLLRQCLAALSSVQEGQESLDAVQAIFARAAAPPPPAAARPESPVTQYFSLLSQDEYFSRLSQDESQLRRAIAASLEPNESHNSPVTRYFSSSLSQPSESAYRAPRARSLPPLSTFPPVAVLTNQPTMQLPPGKPPLTQPLQSRLPALHVPTRAPSASCVWTTLPSTRLSRATTLCSAKVGRFTLGIS